MVHSRNFNPLVGIFCMAVAVARATAAKSLVDQPLSDLSLDAATGSLLNSFNRLLEDQTKATNQSEFTRQLSDAALRIIYNVSPSLISTKVEAQTEAAARTIFLPNPDGEGCLARDYSSMCPEDFYDVGDGKICKASISKKRNSLKLYSGNCDKTQDLSNTTPVDKRAFASRCGTNLSRYWRAKRPFAKCSGFHSCVRQKDFRRYEEASRKNW
ncbi:cpw-wpc domain-containing protein [Besnoitia besnoiti]|uniref:Cpw-wpc domain-containing protein n=1 Tax=Besnoitia besnoiti TaxID=94643 RepID=A0A2A9MGU6_BESBE|nr:cpw-wpc domain-containing protein [Besnoitia besnoiti]PFH37748.1 cpw-wpc domain-containing protein [Besnoitia besnoiti]